MKTLFFISMIISQSFLGIAQIEKAEFQASGLTCSMCSNAINKALKTVPFIETVNVNLNKNLFVITFKKNEQVDFDLIKKKVEDAGFSIAKFWITVDLSNQKIDNDEHITVGTMNFHFMNVKSQILNGSERLQLIDKNYISSKEFKKFGESTSMPCYKTGMMGNCCKSKDGVASSTGRIYHVTI
jgi:copper chaperone CopZ